MNTQRENETLFEAKMSAEFWLNLAGKDFRLVGKSVRIGRAPDNDIVLEHKSVSRYHAQILVHAGAVFFEDLKSRNGIKVNGLSVRRVELKDNDSVKVGDLAGLFFLRQKRSTQGDASMAPLKSFDWKRFSLITEIGKLDPSKKRMALIVAFMAIVGLWMITGGGSKQNHTADASSSPEVLENVVDAVVNRQAYETCLELEDLGHFRQAVSCYKKLPQTEEVQRSRLRVQKRQTEPTKTRYLEGKQAYDNYYFDIAILKWHEVLLIADDASEFRSKAVAEIQQAEIRRGQK